MRVSYSKLFKLLIDRQMTRKDLREAAGISESSVWKLGKNEKVSLDVLLKVCAALQVDIGDIMEVKLTNPPHLTVVTDELYAELVKEAETATANGHTYNQFEMLGVLEKFEIVLNGNSFNAVERLVAEGYVNPVKDEA